MEQIPGQMSIEDFLGGVEALKPAPQGIARKTAEERREEAQRAREGTETAKAGTRQCGSCKWSFWKHGKEGTKRSCQYHGGKDGCHYEERRTCRTCGHMQRSVYGLMEYHGFACFGFGISKSQDIEQEACVDYEPAMDEEAWRTDDMAARAWVDGDQGGSHDY